MKNYNHSDASSLWTRTQLVAYVSLFVKRAKAIQLIDLVVSKNPTLYEEAIFHKKVTLFYSNDILIKLDKISPEFKMGRSIRNQEIKNQRDWDKQENNRELYRFVFGPLPYENSTQGESN